MKLFILVRGWLLTHGWCSRQPQYGLAYIYMISLLFIPVAIYAQNNINYIGQVQYDVRASNLWGYADEDGNEYALIGLYNGTSIVDISNPSEPAEIFFVPGQSGIWRELKTYNDHAYIVNETGGGLQIVDLTDLPVSIDTAVYTADSFSTAHTIFIDENGFAYLFGANRFAGTSTIILDLNPDPMNPVKAGEYTNYYIHDGYVRNDTLWAAEIYNGQFGVIDVSDKSNPVDLGVQTTPSSFTHNCWLNDEGNYLFTTDEISGAYVTAYDVSDVTDIKEVDRYQHDPGSGVIPHNTYWLNDYLINSYYKDGVTIVDATMPDNLIEVGWYDTSPFPSENGFAGCWGLYPYLPSGLIIASDIEEGLFILQPDYQRAAYLEGTVTDEIAGTPVIGANIEIIGTDNSGLTDVTGDFKTGIGDEGLYDVRISKAGCITKIIPGIELIQSEITELNETIACTSFVDIPLTDKEILFDAYSNVYSDQLIVMYAFDHIYAHAAIQLYDIAGNEIYSAALNNDAGTISINQDISPGFYFVSLLADDRLIRTVKVVKS